MKEVLYTIYLLSQDKGRGVNFLNLFKSLNKFGAAFVKHFLLCFRIYLFSLSLTFYLIGEAGNGQGSMTKRDVVPYDGSKSHIATYNFCYLCKERLDTYHDDQDESWYFIDTRQVRFSCLQSRASGQAGNSAAAE